jgi:hypothetical protein
MLMAFLGASALVVASAGPALAECMTWPDRATERLHVGYAFKGTVVGVSKTEDLEFYPRAARTASTTADVLRLINGAAMPDTSTAPLDQPPTPTPAPVLALVFAASLGLMLLVGRHSMDGPRRPYRRRPRPQRAEPGERSIHRGRIRERH